MAKTRLGKRERAELRARLGRQEAAGQAHDPSWRGRSCLNVTQTVEWGSDFRVLHETSKHGARWPNAPRRKNWMAT